MHATRPSDTLAQNHVKSMCMGLEYESPSWSLRTHTFRVHLTFPVQRLQPINPFEPVMNDLWRSVTRERRRGREANDATNVKVFASVTGCGLSIPRSETAPVRVSYCQRIQFCSFIRSKTVPFVTLYGEKELIDILHRKSLQINLI